MLEIVAKTILEELRYSGSLHIRHIKVCPTYKDAAIELLLTTGRVVLSDDGTILYPSFYYPK